MENTCTLRLIKKVAESFAVSLTEYVKQVINLSCITLHYQIALILIIVDWLFYDKIQLYIMGKSDIRP